MICINEKIDELDINLDSYLYLDFNVDAIDNNESFFDQIIKDTTNLIENYNDVINVTFKQPLEKYHQLQQNVLGNNIQFNAQSKLNTIIEDYKSYLSNDYKAQLVVLFKSLTQLEEIFNSKNLDIKEIPNLLLSIKNLTPKYLHTESKIKEIVIEIVNHCKQILLNKYHVLLNQKLDYDSFSKNSNDDTPVWEDYITESNNWLLSYTLLALFPSTLIQTNEANILEKFQEAFDEALIPFWGRFYHHLKVSRSFSEEMHGDTNLNNLLNSYNQKQIIWSFKYAKSFFLMIYELNLNLTNNKDLISFLNINYNHAGNKFLIEKLIKFMRAHLASIIEVYFEDHASYIYSLTLSKEKEIGQSFNLPEICLFLLRLVDSTLNFDSFINSKYSEILLNKEDKHSISNSQLKFNKSLFPGLCSVIYDSKITFHTWLSLEYSLVLNFLRDSLDNKGDLKKFNDIINYSYSDKFIKIQENIFNSQESVATQFNSFQTFSTSISILSNILKDNLEQISSTNLNCYSIIYNNLNLFSTLINRYNYFPFSAKKILIDLILSPLLCYTLGHLVYRLKTHNGFYNLITNGSKFKFKGKTNCLLCNQYYNSCKCIQDFQYFKNTVYYLQSSLTNFSCSSSSILTEDSTVQKKWKIIQNWIPNILITETHAKSNFSPYNLLKISMKCSESFHLFYFNNSFESLIIPSSNSSSSTVSSFSSSHQIFNIPDDTFDYRPKATSTSEEVTILLDNSLILTRGLSITLYDLLKNELDEKLKDMK